MKGQFGTKGWYVDVRESSSGHHISFELCHHLPRRLGTGRILAVADNPRIFLSALRKRWTKLIHDVTRQLASTLDRTKREGLKFELERLQTARFTAKPDMLLAAQTNAFILAPDLLTDAIPSYKTVYIAANLSRDQMRKVLNKLEVSGLLVVYGSWPKAYDDILNEYN